MRKFANRTLARGLLALALTAGPFALAAGPLAAPAKAEMVFRRGNDAEPDTLDPARSSTTWEFNILGDMFLGLTTEDTKAKPIPGAAQSWTISPDGLVWTFTLRPGLVWSDGVPLKASDYVAGFRRVLDPKTASQYAFIQYVIKNAEAVNSGKMPVDQVGVRAIDDRTVEITLENPTPFLPGLLTHSTAFPFPEHIYKKYGDDWEKPGNIATNGAYVMTEWTPHDHVTLKKNPKFYDAANVAIDTVIYYPIENDSQALARYRAGGIDVFIGRSGFPIDATALVNEILPGQAHTTVMLASEYLVGNMRRPPFNDIRVRRAVALCIDQNLLVYKVFKDGSKPAASLVPPGIADYHGGPHVDYIDWPIDKRRDEAKHLLAEAGYTAKHPLEFEYKQMQTPKGRRDVITEAAMLKECGIIAHIYFNEAKVYYSALQQGDFTFAWGGWVADYNDPYTYLHLLDSRAGPYNYQGYNNPAFDRLLDEAQKTQDIDARADILARAEQLALDDAALVPEDFSTNRGLIQTYVKGYEENVTDVHRSRWMRVDRPAQ